MPVVLVATIRLDNSEIRQTLINLLGQWIINNTANLEFLAQQSDVHSGTDQLKYFARFESSLDANNFIDEFSSKIVANDNHVCFEILSLCGTSELDSLSVLF